MRSDAERTDQRAEQAGEPRGGWETVPLREYSHTESIPPGIQSPVNVGSKGEGSPEGLPPPISELHESRPLHFLNWPLCTCPLLPSCWRIKEADWGGLKLAGH